MKATIAQLNRRTGALAPLRDHVLRLNPDDAISYNLPTHGYDEPALIPPPTTHGLAPIDLRFGTASRSVHSASGYDTMTWPERTDGPDYDSLGQLSLHKYLYANANPIYYSDPSGNFSIIGTLTTLAKGMGYSSLGVMGVHMGLSGIANVAVEYAFSGGEYRWTEAFVDFGIGAATAPIGGAATMHLTKVLGVKLVKTLGTRLAMRGMVQLGSSFFEALGDTAAFLAKEKFYNHRDVTLGTAAEYFAANLFFTTLVNQVPVGLRKARLVAHDELAALSGADKGAWKRWLNNFAGVSGAALREKRELLQRWIVPILDTVNYGMVARISGFELADFVQDLFINVAGEGAESQIVNQ